MKGSGTDTTEFVCNYCGEYIKGTDNLVLTVIWTVSLLITANYVFLLSSFALLLMTKPYNAGHAERREASRATELRGLRSFALLRITEGTLFSPPIKKASKLEPADFSCM